MNICGVLSSGAVAGSIESGSIMGLISETTSSSFQPRSGIWLVNITLIFKFSLLFLNSSAIQKSISMGVMSFLLTLVRFP